MASSDDVRVCTAALVAAASERISASEDAAASSASRSDSLTTEAFPFAHAERSSENGTRFAGGDVVVGLANGGDDDDDDDDAVHGDDGGNNSFGMPRNSRTMHAAVTRTSVSAMRIADRVRRASAEVAPAAEA